MATSQSKIRDGEENELPVVLRLFVSIHLVISIIYSENANSTWHASSSFTSQGNLHTNQGSCMSTTSP